MARVVIAPSARDDPERLINTHSLPTDTTARVKRSFERLEQFPRLGRAIEHGRWAGYRFILGPWRWLIILYKYDDQRDTVMVALLEDGRTATASRTSTR